MTFCNEMHEWGKKQFAEFLRQEIELEKMLTLDFGYISDLVGAWWGKREETSIYILKAELVDLFLKNIHKQDLTYFNTLGLAGSKIAAVCIKNIFTIDNPKLSFIVHEALSDLFNITDIKYPYEEHKTLYLKSLATQYKDWGSGYGEITPHSDDLYENLNVDYLSLTVCRDITKTATECFFPKDILRSFTDDELFRLKDITAKFSSGKNVDVLIERERNILEYSRKYGFRFFLDFRVDNITGQRMKPINTQDQALFDKMAKELENCERYSSVPETGTYFIVANNKVLHARSQMNLDKKLAEKFSNNASLNNTPRLLYRSKGPRREYLEFN